VRWQEAVSEAVARRQGLPSPDRRSRLLAGVAFAVLSNAVNRWMDVDAACDLAAEVDEGFDLLQHRSGEPDPYERRSPGNG
jgi:MftR C-terminal domain